MEEPLFFNWFCTVFVKYVEKKRIDLKTNTTALLLYDGHCSHISVRIIETVMRHNIILFKFPSHLTDKLQPLDKCVFGPLKTLWEKKLIQFGRSVMRKGPGRVTKSKFTEILGSLWSVGMKSQNITAGFTSIGAFPVDKTKFSLSDFDPIDLNEYLGHEAEKNTNIPTTSSYNQHFISNETPNDFELDIELPATSYTINTLTDSQKYHFVLRPYFKTSLFHYCYSSNALIRLIFDVHMPKSLNYCYSSIIIFSIFIKTFQNKSLI